MRQKKGVLYQGLSSVIGNPWMLDTPGVAHLSTVWRIIVVL
jgi:hypothetical protein